MNQDGYLLNFHAHLHDGGVNVRVLKNGTAVCDSKAVYGTTKANLDGGKTKWESIQGYEFCYKPVTVAKGDEITIESNYDTGRYPL
jgi:hypothetical protein